MTAGLSCYTASLHAYLATEWNATEVVARSVRLAVHETGRDGLLAFSHHCPSLDQLPNGERLVYAGAASAPAALAPLRDELSQHGRVVVKTDNAKLPWSPSPDSAPHWLLVNDLRADRWHVDDPFAATFPSGDQHPFRGWLSTPELLELLSLPDQWEPDQRLRNTLAFGAPVPVPPLPTLWLERRSADTSEPHVAPTPDPHVGIDALSFLVCHLTSKPAAAGRHLVDVWAAAGHHAFAHRWLLDGALDEDGRKAHHEALAAWSGLPQHLHFAFESARRGRPRLQLIDTVLTAVIEAETRVGALP